MTDRPLAFAALLCALAVTACGGGSTQAKNSRQVVLTAAQLTQAQPFRMDGSIHESFGGSGALGAAPGPLTLNVHFDVENSARSTGTLGTTVEGRPLTVNTTVYDGTVYISTDGGVTYKSTPAGTATSQYGPAGALQYLQSVGAVTDEGGAEADGIAVERYHAQLDPVRVTQTLKSAIEAAAPSLAQVANAMQFKSGSIDVGIDHQGRLVAEEGTFGVTVDLGAVQSSFRGQTLDVSLTLNSHFYDYGANIVVTKPTNVTGNAPT